jgi:hypothetical protein
MLSNRSGIVYALGAAVITAPLRLLPHPCPLQSQVPQVSADAGDWGIATNLALQREPHGLLISTTEASGRHRVLKNIQIEKPGRYRLSVETKFDGARYIMIELGGQRAQSYGFVIVDQKSGKIIQKSGDITDAGVDSMPDRPGWYRWWAHMNYTVGRTAVDLAILDYGKGPIFTGNSTCKLIVSGPTFVSM